MVSMAEMGTPAAMEISRCSGVTRSATSLRTTRTMLGLTAMKQMSELPRARAPLVLIAQDEAGYRALMRLASRVWLEPKDGDEPHIGLAALEDSSGLIALTGGPAGPIDRALALGGTLSGEHGIGMAKSRFLEKETSRATILYSRRIKAALDPKNILNPGKIIGE